MPIVQHVRPAAPRLALLCAAVLALTFAPADPAPARDGPKRPCKTARLKHLPVSDVCTHGRDPAPRGFAVGRPVAPLPRSATASPAVDCDGDGTSGNRVQVVYFRASDVPSRYADYLPTFRQLAAEVDDIVTASAAQTGGQRSLRFVHDSACVATVPEVVGPPGSDDDFDSTVAALDAAGYDRADRKYMIFADAAVLCGIGSLWPNDGPSSDNPNNFGPSYGRSDNGCWSARVAAHELVHNLGGVQLSAPHTSGGFHCVDEYDVMCYSDDPHHPTMQILCPDPALESRLDCGDDDYFNTSPAPGSYLATHWNVANSAFLLGSPAPPPPPCPPDGDIEAEDDGSAAGAREIVAGTTERRAFCAASDADWYRFERAAGEPIRLETLNLATGTDTVLTLYAADGTTAIATDDDGGDGLASRIDFTPAGSGTYRLEAVQFDGSGAPDRTYDLRVDTTPSSCPDATLEPDDASGSAHALTPGAEQARAFCHSADRDWISFEANAGTKYRVETLDLSGGNDTVVELYADDGTTKLAENDDSGGTLASAVEFTPAASGRLRAVVRHYSGKASAAYRYRLRLTSDDTTAPTVVARSPAPEATGVAREATVEVTFSEPVQGVSAGTFQLRAEGSAQPVPASVFRDGATNRWILDPAADLAPETRHAVSLTGGPGGIADLAGNPLADAGWGFATVAAPIDPDPDPDPDPEPDPEPQPDDPLPLRPPTTIIGSTGGGQAGGTSGVTGVFDDEPDPPPLRASVGVTLRSAMSLGRLLRGFRVSADRAGRFRADVVARTVRGRVVAARRAVIARGSLRLTRAGAARLVPSLTWTGVRAIRGRRRTYVAVVVTFRPADGGRAVVRRRSVRLRLR